MPRLPVAAHPASDAGIRSAGPCGPLLVPLALGLALALGCSGLFSPVSESDELVGRGSVAIPVPSSAVLTGWVDDAHRARVEDALCQGEIPVWGELEQAVLQSTRKGEVHADITKHYTSLVADCPDRSYCDRARARLPNSPEEVAAFYVHVLATCGDLGDRVLFREFDAEPRAVATFYTSGPVPPHREPADDGALILAAERLIQRGSLEPVVSDALWNLLRLDNPEPAETLAPLAATANLDVADELLKGLAGQSSEAAVRAVEAACQRNPDKEGVCGVEAKGPMPGHDAAWLATLAATTDADRAQDLLDAHPELHEAARARLAECGEPCAPVASLLDPPDPNPLDWLDEKGVDPRPDRADKAAFPLLLTTALDGRGRLVQVNPSWRGDRLLRRLAFAARPALEEASFHDEIGPDGARVAAVEVGGTRYQVPVAGEALEVDLARVLLNRVLERTEAPLRLVELADGAVAALTPAAIEALDPTELSPPE